MMMNQQPMRFRFLGTGAADQPWERLGGDPEVRGSSCVLVDGRILIDAGKTLRRNLDRFGIDPEAVTDLVITHGHGDHCDRDAIAWLMEKAAPAIHADRAVLEQLAGLPAERHVLEAGRRSVIAGLEFTALPANHGGEFPGEQPLHFLISDGRRRVLFALDGGWMTTRERLLIGDARLDLIIWDATVSEPGDWRSFEHNDLGMIAMMQRALANSGVIDSATRTVLTHIGHSLWPHGEAAVALAREHGHILAHDGMELTLE